MNNITLITDANNRFYAGMTHKEAQARGVDKSFWRRDFHNLDKNGDGVLSINEIMNERKRSSKINKFTAAAFAALGVVDGLTGKGKWWTLLDLAFDGFIAVHAFSRAVKTDKQTKVYEKLIQDKGLKMEITA